MRFPTFAYQKFYWVLLQKFKEACDPDDYKDKDDDWFGIWEDGTDRITGKPFFSKVFGKGVHERHFYKKVCYFEKNDIKEAHIKDDLMITSLNFLGYKIPEGIKNKELITPAVKAKTLYQMFLMEHFAEYYNENIEGLQIYDPIENRILKDRISNTRLVGGSKKSSLMTERQESIQTDEARLLIRKFYDYISNSEFEEGWSLLTPQFREKNYKDKIEDFKIGYTNTINVGNVHVFDIEKDNTMIDCKVFYEDTVLVHTSPALAYIQKTTIADIADLQDRVGKLQQLAAKTAIENFDKIEVARLFDSAVSEYIWYKGGKNPDTISDLLPNQESLVIPRLVNVSCVLLKDKWQIKRISAIKAQALR